METPQKVTLPPAFYPVRLVSWKVRVGDQVEKDQILGIFESSTPAAISAIPKGEEDSSEPHAKPNAASALHKHVRGEIRSAFVGRVDSLDVRPNDLITDPTKALMVIIEPCGHPVQLNGLCAVCGQDLSIADYTGTETTRATIAMTHDSFGVTVSTNEAFRIENETTSRLKRERKLSLVLDLDQTVIHATVDPTVGEWMADPENPNFPALSDVHSFVLPDSPVVYYIKLRPQTRQFLKEMHKKYEMHIYTMGTRNYARAVAKILDPDQRYFKDRILSRDDSGSFSVKSLQRLFPCDQSMVVVVDDRADVWQWSPNLFRIKPYDFFVGIGDINEPVYAAAAEINEAHKNKSAHHRPGGVALDAGVSVASTDTSSESVTNPAGRDRSTTAVTTASSAQAASTGTGTQPASSITPVVFDPVTKLPNDVSELEDSKLPSDTESDSETSEHKAEILAKMHDIQLHALEDQQKNRPLLHFQEEADAEVDAAVAAAAAAATAVSAIADVARSAAEAASKSTSSLRAAGSSRVGSIGNASTGTHHTVSTFVSSSTTTQPQPASSVPAQRPTVLKKRPVLVDQDRELELIKSLMSRTHRRFYKRVDLGASTLADVRAIVPEMKRSVLDGVRILFSSIIPLGTDPRRHEHWIAATSFGATCHLELDDAVTHVIAGKKGTAKVNAARDRPGVVIVRLEWLTESIRNWARADELSFLFDPELVPLSLPPRPSHAVAVRRLSNVSANDGDDGDKDSEGDEEDDDDENEILIAAGKWDGAEDIEKLGDDSWQEMDDEVDRAMMEEGDDDDDDDDDDDNCNDDALELGGAHNHIDGLTHTTTSPELSPQIRQGSHTIHEPTRALSGSISTTVAAGRSDSNADTPTDNRQAATPKTDQDDDDWDALVYEIVDELQQSDTPPPPPPKHLIPEWSRGPLSRIGHPFQHDGADGVLDRDENEQDDDFFHRVDAWEDKSEGSTGDGDVAGDDGPDEDAVAGDVNNYSSYYRGVKRKYVDQDYGDPQAFADDEDGSDENDAGH